METIKASISVVDEKRYIKIELEDEEVLIPMSEDQADKIKTEFNKLIIRIKKNVFQIKLEGIGEDLFSQVASEYIQQLNREIKEVYAEMKQYDLTS
jgi:hypothetical protein